MDYKKNYTPFLKVAFIGLLLVFSLNKVVAHTSVLAFAKYGFESDQEEKSNCDGKVYYNKAQEVKDSVSSIKLYRKALFCFQQTEDTTDILKSYFGIGIYYITHFDSTHFMPMMDTVYMIAKEYGDTSLLADCDFIMARHYAYVSEFTESIYYFENALEKYRILDDTLKLRITYKRLISNYINAGFYMKAEDQCIAYIMMYDNPNSKNCADIYFSLGSLNNQFGDYHKALVYIDSAYAGHIFQKNYSAIADDLLAYAAIYTNTMEDHKSLTYAFKALQTYKKYHIEEGYGASYITIGDIYFNLNEYENAVIYYDSAEYSFKKYKLFYGIPQISQSKANLYLKTMQYDKALAQLDSTKNRIDRYHFGIQLLVLYESYVTAYTKTNDYKNAFLWQKKITEYKDSVFYDREESFKSKLLKLQNEKRLKKNIILKQKLNISNREKQAQIVKKRINFYLFLITIIFLVVLSILFFLFKKNVMHKRRLNELKVAELRKTIELQEQQRLRVEKEKLYINEQNSTLKLKQELTNQKLEARNNMLLASNNALLQQSKTIELLHDAIKELKPKMSSDQQKLLKQVEINIQAKSSEVNWQNFLVNFTAVYPFFFNNLEAKYSSLTMSEKRLCAMILMGLKTSAISAISQQRPGTLRVHRHRIRQKLNLKPNEDLKEFLQKQCGVK